MFVSLGNLGKKEATGKFLQLLDLRLKGVRRDYRNSEQWMSAACHLWCHHTHLSQLRSHLDMSLTAVSHGAMPQLLHGLCPQKTMPSGTFCALPSLAASLGPRRGPGFSALSEETLFRRFHINGAGLIPRLTGIDCPSKVASVHLKSFFCEFCRFGSFWERFQACSLCVA